MDDDRAAQREVYLKALGDFFPWVPSDRLGEAASHVTRLMSSEHVRNSPSFNREIKELAEQEGRQLAEMLGKAPTGFRRAQ